MKQMGCTEVTPLARLGVFSMSEVAREDNALMNYVFFQKPAPVSASFDIAFHVFVSALLLICTWSGQH